MPKVNVYLPERLARSVRDSNLPVSAICQRALSGALRKMPETGYSNYTLLGVYGRFLPRARAALELAREEADRYEQPQIDTEHLLLGILEQGSNAAVGILEHMGVAPDDLRSRLYARMSQGEGATINATLEMLLTPAARKVIELAAGASVRLAHQLPVRPYGDYIGNEHLLIGLVAEEKGLAAQVLSELGVDLDSLLPGAQEVQAEWVDADDASSPSKLPAVQPTPAASPTTAAERDRFQSVLDDVLSRLSQLENRLAESP